MPSETSHVESAVRPPRALAEMNGAPLSHWIARGVPYSAKSSSRTRRTPAPRVLGRSLAVSTNRLYESRTVNGSHRCPLRARHQPLKSIVQRSSGPTTSACGRPSTVQRRTLARRRFTFPRRSSVRATVLLLGVAAPDLLIRTREILSGPQLEC